MRLSGGLHLSTPVPRSRGLEVSWSRGRYRVTTQPRDLATLLFGVRGHELLADGAEDALIGERGQIDEVLPIFVAVEYHHKAIDPKGHRSPQVAILGGEV